jgi:Domain of unknown function (DUF1835)
VLLREDLTVIPRDDPRATLRAVLHVTNGDSTVESLRRARPVAGDIVAWRDVLHEGPVPALTDAEMRPVRAEFLATTGPAGAAEIEAGLRARDERLERAIEAGERIVLWFEHDLYDQLQLLQILAGLPDRPNGVELICIGSFPGRPGFAGLGELDSEELASLWPVRAAVTHEHVRAARAAWAVFRGTDPTALARAAATPDERLPFLAPALGRLLEELPGARDGLARTERQLLAAVAAGARTREWAFVDAAAGEPAPFLGDTIAFQRLQELARGREPLVTEGPQLELTAAGAEVLAARADRVALIGFDRWLGGLHLRAGDALWRWDGERGALVAP